MGQTSESRPARLRLSGWGGTTEQAVEVIGETPQRYRIRALVRTRLVGRRRYLEAGDMALVPKYAIRFEGEGGK